MVIKIDFWDKENENLIDTYMKLEYKGSVVEDVIYTTDPANDVGPNSFYWAINKWPNKMKEYLRDPEWFARVNKEIEEEYKEYDNIKKLKFIKEEGEIYVVGGGRKLQYNNGVFEVIKEGRELKDVFTFLEILLTELWL